MTFRISKQAGYSLSLVSLLILLLVASATMTQGDQIDRLCGEVARPCMIDGGTGGRYYIVTPSGWDGVRPLGALVFFHGYRSSGAEFTSNPTVVAAAHRGGYALVAADGLDGTWSHSGSPTRRRDETVYVSNLLDDLARRIPLDRKDLWAAGFSQGGSMVWEMACHLGERFKAFVAISGAFWEPLPQTCTTGPVSILHIHGGQDRTVPMLGRRIGSYKQGEVLKSFEIMREVNHCAPQSSVSRVTGAFVCETWSNCQSRHRLQLCMHNGAHQIPAQWDDLAYRFLSDAKR
jgi:polyhydroxybutyrate depolymerase